MKKIFLTFADSRLQRSLRRITHQAKHMHVYDEVLALTENSLDQNFKSVFAKQLRIGTKGYGYWCWKPQIILQTMQNMADGDLLQYTDAGCHLNPNGRERLLEYFSMVNASQEGVLAFSAKEPEPPLVYDGRRLFDYPDRKWVKGDLIDFFGVRDRGDILEAPTIGAGIIFFRKCDASVRLLKAWIDVFTRDFTLIDDSPSRTPNLEGFLEHRHDQSIFSILCKLNNVQTISAYEYYYPSSKGDGPDWASLEKFPVHARRDKDRGLFINALRRAKAKLRELRRLLSL